MLGPTSCGGKCAFGTSATDTDWRMRPLNWLWLAISIRKREVLATEVRDFVRKERDDHFERFIEHVETFGECGAKAYAVGVGLFIIPTSAKTKFEPTIRNHVDSRSHIRHHRRVPEYLLAQQKEEWVSLPQPRTEERRIGLLGLGSLALPVAVMLRDLGFQVASWSRTQKRVEGVESFHGAGRFADFLARTDILLNLLPLTAETRGILDAAAFAAMPKGAAIINLGRGPHVVAADLLAALDSGQLSAATLDVFDIEPLPAGSPLWKHPRITVMPHVARRQRPVDVAPQIAENIRRIRAGEPLLQVIDPQAGY